MRTLGIVLLTMIQLLGFSRHVAAQAISEDLVERQVIVMFNQDRLTLPNATDRSAPAQANMPAEIRALLLSFDTEEIKRGVPEFERRDTLRVLEDGRLHRVPDYTNLFVLTLPGSVNRDSLIARLNRSPHVEYAEENQMVYPRKGKAINPLLISTPPLAFAARPTSPAAIAEVIPVNEPGFGSQWGLRNLSGPDIEATHAWSITRGSSSIKIGIVDTGIGSNNPDLPAR